MGAVLYWGFKEGALIELPMNLQANLTASFKQSLGFRATVQRSGITDCL